MASSELSLILNTANANLYPSDSNLPSLSFSTMHHINHLSDTSFCNNTNNSLAGSWEQINPHLWSRQNILEWIAYYIEESKYDAMLLNLNCCNIDGPTLCSCSRDAMTCTFGTQLGNTLYQSLENLKHRHSFDIQNYIPNDIPSETYDLLNDFLTDFAGPSLDTVIVTDNRTDKKESYFNEYKTQLTPVSDNGYESYPESLQSSLTGGFLSPSSPESASSDSDLENTEACYSLPIKNLKQEPVEKKKRGRPPKMSHGSEHYIENKKNKHAPRGTHLWEFIRDILIHPEKNQGLMKWEDRKDGIFKFLKSEAVAQLWGQKKKNSSMTYEKLSRAMRYYYKREILERVDGRRLVYKFGKNANGWKLEEIGM